MEKCLNCGKTILLKTCFGNHTICKSCDSLVGASSWNKREFSSMDELLEKKKTTLKLAKTNSVSDQFIDAIENYFDEYIKDGFVTSINGRAGQTLKVFENYCIVYTKSESAKNSLVNLFYQFDDDDYEIEDGLSATEKMDLAKSVLKGGLIRTGIGVAISASAKQEAKEKAIEKRERERERKVGKIIKVGDKKLLFKNFSGFEIFNNSGTSNGYLKFVPVGIKPESLYECDYFFFNNSIPFESKKIKQKVEKIKDVLEDKLEKNKVKETKTIDEKVNQEVVEKVEVRDSKETKVNGDSKFDEIRKYKALLDDGIITEEEFNAKKKELLNL